MKRAIILGGGLAGLVSGILLNRSGIPVTLIEKKRYPFHRVCGEYISNEAAPFLKDQGIYPSEFSPAVLRRFQLSAVSGRSAQLDLDMGGFGISRYSLDNYLYETGKAEGVDFILDTEVQNVSFSNEKFIVSTMSLSLECDVVIGAFGKRSKLDTALGRDFSKRRSPYVGVKYHIHTSHPADLIALHNFNGGYCGISNIEDGKTNLCYLVHREVVRQTGDIKAMEEEVLFKNPLLKDIFLNSDFLFKKPEVINEISFRTKSTIEDHILMAGDSAGMITPLCGNGMAMAIHAAKILSNLVSGFCNDRITRQQLENQYARSWRRTFSQRLWAGRQIQNLFGSPSASNLAINLAIHVKPIARSIMRNTHGEVFS